MEVDMRIVGYTRVSTQKQGRSGLGLEAQRAAIQALCAQRGGVIIKDFTEVESGKRNDRPELGKALHFAKVTGATLVIAKLDRLSRNAAFLLALRDSGARFIAADMPDANEMTVGIMALVAEHERQATSKRTQEALAAARARGQRLGNPNGAAALRRASKGNAASVKVIQAGADSRAEDLRPVIESMRAEGISTFGALAEQLNTRGMLTARGGQWHKSSVRNLLARLGPISPSGLS
jgi:DNA invertase Pin-like site-specific DNA recombinase